MMGSIGGGGHRVKIGALKSMTGETAVLALEVSTQISRGAGRAEKSRVLA